MSFKYHGCFAAHFDPKCSKTTRIVANHDLSLQGAETRARPRGPLAQVGGAVTDQCKEGGHLPRVHQPRGEKYENNSEF